MDAEQFLRAVWPEAGIFCIAMPYARGRGFEQHTFNSISNAVSHALQASASGRDVYFNVHTLKAPKVWNPKVKDEHGTEIGAYQIRTQANMAECRAFFFDIDVGPEKDYTSRPDALNDLVRFCAETKLPKPLVVSSGGGFHVYWLLSEAIVTADWRDAATKLKKLAAHFGLKIDQSRTTDVSSVLRVVGTNNYKNPAVPKRVKTLGPSEVIDTAAFLAILDRNSVFVAPLTVNTAEATLDSKAISIVQVGKACASFQEMVKTAASHTEPQWHAFLGLMHFVDDGRMWAHKISRMYPTYDEAETNDKFDRVGENQTGPTRCARISDLGYSSICDKCWYKAHRDTSAPTVAARRMARTYTGKEIIPPPPVPYSRLDVGGVAMDQDGVLTVISPFDLYPSALISDHSTGEAIMHAEWAAELPNRGTSNFRIAMRALQDTTALSSRLADKGVVLQHDDLKHVRHYMVAYIQKLQQSLSDTRQHTHLGWTDDYKEFVLPSGVYTTAGIEKAALLTDSALYSARHVTRQGDRTKQVELLKFYDHPEYVRQQFVIGCGFAAPLFYMTGQHGIIVNAQGETGASKSTSLYTAASIWGEPEGYTLNGTNSGATANARGLRLSILANLPVCYDEVTYMDTEDAKDLAISITQPQEKIRLDKDSKERQNIAAQRSTIMISSSNGSLHEKLSVKNVAGTASSMRVFEIDYPRLAVHNKRQADDFLRGLRENYGHLGPAFIAYVANHQYAVKQQVIEAMRFVDDAGKIEPHERYHSACIAAAVTALRIAHKLGLVTYDPEAVLRWALKDQLPAMRGMIDTNYADPVDNLVAYVNASRQDMLIVNNINGKISAVERPQRVLGLRYEIDTMLLTVSLAHLKAYCQQRNMPLGSMLSYLERTLGASRIKATLGKGLADMSFGQVRCLTVNLRNEVVMGKLDFAHMTADSNVVELKRSVAR